MTMTGGLLAGPAVKPQAFRTDRAPGLPPGSPVAPSVHVVIAYVMQ